MGTDSARRGLAGGRRPPELYLDLSPYVAGEDTRLFDDVPKSYRLDLVSSTPFRNGTVGLHYRRPPLTKRAARVGLRDRRRAAVAECANDVSWH